MNEAELDALINKRVKEGVKEMLLSLGVDASSSENVSAWQQRFHFLANTERASKTAWGHFWTVIVGMAAAGMAWLVWAKVGAKP